jgi:hypothetical protein
MTHTPEMNHQELGAQSVCFTLFCSVQGKSDLKAVPFTIALHFEELIRGFC